MKTVKNLTAEEIKKSILQLAIQGKLVKQDPNDEPASELVKKIYAEKYKLIKEGKIKKEKDESYIFKADDNCYYEKIGNSEPVKLKDLPFDIPDNWMWMRQKDICWLETGKKAGGMRLPYLEAKVIRGLKEPVILEEGIVVDPRNRIILVDGENSGEIMVPPYKGYMGSTFKIFSSTAFFNYEYLSFIFLLNKNLYKNSKVGAAIPHLNKSIFKESLIAVPPLNEQKRIVDKINSLEPLLKDYEAIENKLTLLESEFPDKLKKSILEYAIQGKLVNQDPNDEPASVLLDRIKAEKEKLIKEGKIKRDKNESYIYQGDDKNYYEKISKDINRIEVPFDIPDNWCWVRHNSIFEIFGGSQPSKNKFVKTSKVGYIRLYQIRDYGPNPNPVYIPLCYAHKITKKGDILLARYGASLGKVFFAEDGAYNVAMAKVEKLFESNYISNNYLFFYYKSSLYKNIVLNNSRSAQAGFNKEDLRTLLFPIPPLNEQKRIVKTINCLFDEINN